MSQRARRISIAWVLIVAFLLLALIITAVVLIQDLLSPVAELTPTLPPSLATLHSDWAFPILLPTTLPDCFTYASNAASVENQAEARGGKALIIRFANSDSRSCRQAAQDANLTLTEAPALDSLQGSVTTVSGNRGQYARLNVPDADGRNRVILQWHCGVMMCRVAGDIGGNFSEPDLLRTSESVRQVAP